MIGDSLTSRHVPFDVLAGVTFTIVGSAAVFASPISGTPPAIVLALPLFLFCPGYVAVTALFPTVSLRGYLGGGRSGAAAETPDGISRAAGEHDCVAVVVLSAVGSVCVSMLVGFALGFSPWGLTRLSFPAGLVVTTVVFGLIGVYRRPGVTDSSPHPAAETTDGGHLATSTRRDTLVKGFAAVGAFGGAATVVATLASPPRGETYTEFYLLSRNQSDELVADDYPRTFRVGEAKSVVVGIANREQRTVEYTIIVEVQRLSGESDGAIAERSTVARFTPEIPAGETLRESVAVEPTIRGENLRLAWYLYHDGAPDRPSRETAYRSLHVSVSVTEGGS